MDKDSNLIRAKGWLYALGVLGALIVIVSTAINHINSGITIVGYVIGFICMLLGAMAAFGSRGKGNKSPKTKKQDK